MAIEDRFMALPLRKINMHKFIILVLKKLEMGHILSSSMQMSNNLELQFQDYMDRHGLASVFKDEQTNQQCKIEFDYPLSSKTECVYLKFFITEDLIIDSNHVQLYKPYIPEEENVRVISTFNLKLPLNLGQLVLNDDTKDKIKKTMLKFQQYYDNYEYSYKYFAALESLSIGNMSIGKNPILQFSKFSKYFNFFNNSQPIPCKEKVKQVIDIIINNSKSVKDVKSEPLTAKSSNFSVIYHPSYNKWVSITLKLGSYTVFNGYYIEMFKYMFHPGLYTLVNYLDISDNIVNLDLVIQKQLFKRV